VWSLLVISVAWLAYRPMIGVPLVLVAVSGLAYLVVYLSKVAARKNAASPAAF